jgi:hypothetical protein
MAICVGYFGDDQSGGDPRTVTVAGYVASKARWRIFDERWSRALRAERLSAFSGPDFRRGTGEFASGWIGDPQRQIRLIRTLTRLTDQHVLAAFSCSLSLEDFDAVNNAYRLAETAGGPYGICAACLIARIQRWMAERCPDDLTLFVLEDGDVDHREIRRVLTAEGITCGEPVQLWPRRWIDELGRQRCLRPFEACDLLALPSMQAAREEEIVDRERLLRVCGGLAIERRAAESLRAPESVRWPVDAERTTDRHRW